MKKIMFITLLAAFALGIMAQEVPFGLEFGQSWHQVETGLQEQGFKITKSGGKILEFENPKIKNLKTVSVVFDSDYKVMYWNIDYYAKDADAFYAALKKMLTEKYGNIYDSTGSAPIWKHGYGTGVYLYRYDKDDVNVRINYNSYYDPEEEDDWWDW